MKPQPLRIEDQQRLENLYETLLEKRQTYIGYPNSALLDNSNLSKFLDLTINNVGDPFVGNNGMHTCDLEKEVLEFFRDILHLDPADHWGYVTNGGTEGNTYGLYLARENFPDGIVYYSEDTHYSVPKAVRLLGLRHALIRSQPNGEMDYEHFRQTVSTLRHYPVIVNCNIGTTMKGAIDQVEKIVAILRELGIDRYHLHCDAALFGSILPFLEGSPLFDFRQDIASVAISGHKFTGSPIPCGVVLARKNLVEKVKGSVEYIGSIDTTLSGSRDGFSVLVLWQALRRRGKEGWKELVEECMELTQYALGKLKQRGWPAWVNPFSNILVIRRPPEAIVRKWHLATEKDIAHLIIMPGVSEAMIDKFVADLAGIYYERLKVSDLEGLVEAVQATFPSPAGETMARALKLTAEEYLSYTRLVCEKAIKDGLCVVAKDHFWGRIVGFCIAEDFLSLPAYKNEKISEKFLPLLDLLETLDDQYARNRSIARGEVLHLYLLGVRTEWSGRGIGTEILGAAMRMGKEAGFKVAIAEATGAGSQQICERLGFKTVGELEYWTYKYNGRLAFGSVENPRSCLLVEKMIS